MNRRVVVLAVVLVGIMGSLTVLAQQTYHNPAPPSAELTGAYNDPGGHSDHGDSSGIVVDPYSGHLDSARLQLQEARREVDPNARIDRIITALDELVAGLASAEGNPVTSRAGDGNYRSGHGAQPASHGAGGCG